MAVRGSSLNSTSPLLDVTELFEDSANDAVAQPGYAMPNVRHSEPGKEHARKLSILNALIEDRDISDRGASL